MASGIVTILIVVVVAVAAFFLYRKFKADKELAGRSPAFQQSIVDRSAQQQSKLDLEKAFLNT